MDTENEENVSIFAIWDKITEEFPIGTHFRYLDHDMVVSRNDCEGDDGEIGIGMTAEYFNGSGTIEETVWDEEQHGIVKNFIKV